MATLATVCAQVERILTDDVLTAICDRVAALPASTTLANLRAEFAKAIADGVVREQGDRKTSAIPRFSKGEMVTCLVCGRRIRPRIAFDGNVYPWLHRDYSQIGGWCAGRVRAIATKG